MLLRVTLTWRCSLTRLVRPIKNKAASWKKLRCALRLEILKKLIEVKRREAGRSFQLGVPSKNIEDFSSNKIDLSLHDGEFLSIREKQRKRTNPAPQTEFDLAGVHRVLITQSPYSGRQTQSTPSPRRASIVRVEIWSRFFSTPHRSWVSTCRNRSLRHSQFSSSRKRDRP